MKKIKRKKITKEQEVAEAKAKIDAAERHRQKLNQEHDERQRKGELYSFERSSSAEKRTPESFSDQETYSDNRGGRRSRKIKPVKT